MPRKYVREEEKPGASYRASGRDSELSSESKAPGAVQRESAGGQGLNLGKIIFAVIALVLVLVVLNALPLLNQKNGLKFDQVFTQNEKLPLGVASFKEEFGNRLISYADQNYGFKLNYPVGYLITASPDFGTYLRVQANFPGSSSEIIDVLVDNESSAKDAFGEASKELKDSGILSSTDEVYINGKRAYLVSGELPSVLDDGSKFFVREGFFECKDLDGNPYAAAIVAVIPEEFDFDVLLASYMIRSFKC